MANKKLKFKKKTDYMEWNVLGYKDAFLGDIAWCKMFKKFSFFPDQMCFEKEISITAECHREIADKLDKLNDGFLGERE